MSGIQSLADGDVQDIKKDIKRNDYLKGVKTK
jgi:hypothetical protein